MLDLLAFLGVIGSVGVLVVSLLLAVLLGLYSWQGEL